MPFTDLDQNYKRNRGRLIIILKGSTRIEKSQHFLEILGWLLLFPVLLIKLKKKNKFTSSFNKEMMQSIVWTKK